MTRFGSTIWLIRKPTNSDWSRGRQKSESPAADAEDSFGTYQNREAELAARTAAHGRVVEADIAAAATLAADAQAVAAGLEHGAAGLVAGSAGNAAAVLSVFALADAAREIALTAGNPVQRAAATA